MHRKVKNTVLTAALLFLHCGVASANDAGTWTFRSAQLAKTPATGRQIANIAYNLGKRLEWDGEKEMFTNCDEANALLHYDYRKGYSLA